MEFKHNIPDLSSILEKKISGLKKTTKFQAIGIFDLTDSTKLKSDHGHNIGTEKALKVIFLTKEIIREFSGVVFKELGDGVISQFNDPIQACLAGLSIKKYANKFDLEIKGGITAGMVEVLNLELQEDVYGLIVDKCAKIINFALPNQILIDQSLLEIAGSQLKDYSNIQIGTGKKRTLKGIGETKLYEVSTSSSELKETIKIPFRIHEQGLTPEVEKSFLSIDPLEEIIEMGVRANVLKDFNEKNVNIFIKNIEGFLSKNINVTLLFTDPQWQYERLKLKNDLDKKYTIAIKRLLLLLKNEQRFASQKGFSGKFSIFTYQQPPPMRILCVDPENKVTGRILFCPFLYGNEKTQFPVFEFSYLSNPIIFQKFFNAIKLFIEHNSIPYQ